MTAATGINPKGEIVGRYTDVAGVVHAFVLDAQGTYSTIDYPSATSTFAWGINPQSDIVGHYVDGVRSHGYRLRNGGFESFDFTIGSTIAHSTFAFSINALGAIVGEYKLGLQRLGDPGHAFLFEDGVFTHISPPGAKAAVAWGINSSGESVGYYVDQQVPSVIHGWLRDADGGYSVIDYPGATLTNARAINPSGTIVGLYRDAARRARGFVLAKGTFSSVEYPGALFTRLSGINARGDIVGDYVDAANKTHGFLLTNW
ncbi:MAG: hypothetical protein ACT4R6_11150 [Gemmatimonadaceae bacterium]